MQKSSFFNYPILPKLFIKTLIVGVNLSLNRVRALMTEFELVYSEFNFNFLQYIHFPDSGSGKRFQGSVVRAIDFSLIPPYLTLYFGEN